MTQFAIAQRTIATAAASACWEIRSAASSRPRVLEIGISQVTAVAGVFGLGRPAAIGVTPTSPQAALDESDASLTGLTTAAVAWGTAPTVPPNFFRRFACPATIGAGVIWTFPRGLVIPASSSIVIWVLATAPVCDVWAVLDE